MKATISIVVPIYNIENELRFCLDSILKQTYVDWVCFLIDDGSTDSSGVICDVYAKMDSRFIVLHKENQGVSDTKNLGIEISNSEYIVFIDGDDWIDKNYLSFLYDNITDDTDLVMCHAIMEFSKASVESLHIRPDYIEFSKDNKEKLLLASISRAYAKNIMKKECGFLNTNWGKIYRLKIIKENKIKFEKILLNEDAVFNIKVFSVIRKVKIYNNILYHYRMRDGSAVHSFKKDYLFNYENYLSNIETFIEEQPSFSKEFLDAYRSLVVAAVFNIMKNYFYNPLYPQDKKRSLEIINTINSDRYREVINCFKKSYAINKESILNMFLLKHKKFVFLNLYFLLRPKIKSIYVFLNKIR